MSLRSFLKDLRLDPKTATLKSADLRDDRSNFKLYIFPGWLRPSRHCFSEWTSAYSKIQRGHQLLLQGRPQTKYISSIYKIRRTECSTFETSIAGKTAAGNPCQSPTLSSSILVVIFFLSLQSFAERHSSYIKASHSRRHHSCSVQTDCYRSLSLWLFKLPVPLAIPAIPLNWKKKCSLK